MDVDYWASRIHSDKHLATFPSAHFNSGDLDANEDARTYFTCPFCYFDVDLSVLSAHLQEEHCFDVKNTVCPVCALNLGKDIVGHFRVHHANSIKNRKKSQKSAFRSHGAREISSLYGLTRTGSNMVDASPDPLLAPFLCSTPYTEPKADHPQDISINDASTNLNSESSKTSASREGQGENYGKSMQRAEFFQDLIFSTIF